MFELECNRGKGDYIKEVEAEKSNKSDKKDQKEVKGEASSPAKGLKNLLLKGQMKYLSDINAIIFLCSPVYDFYHKIFVKSEKICS